MTGLTLICRAVTTFAPSGELDEVAQRQFLQRFVDSGLAVYLGSTASGEGHSLKPDELRRLYEIGVDVGKGRIMVNGNPPEAATAEGAIEQAMIAVDAGVDRVNIYGPAAWHGYLPSDEELLDFFDIVFSSVDHPAALAPNPVMGYVPSPAIVAEVVARHPQVVAINLAGQGDAYFVQLKDALTRDVETYVPYTSSLHTLGMGATGLLGAEANILPKTFRRYLDLYDAGEYGELAEVYADIHRFTRYVRRWYSGTPRWIKMAMVALKLPGHAGGIRRPYLMPSDEVMKNFTEGLLALGIAEISEQAADAR